MYTRNKLLLFVLIILLLTVLACSFNIGGPSYPDQHIPVSTEAVGELKSAIQTAAAAGAESGQITLVLNEAQLTSYLAAKLQAQSKPVFTNPQVYLQDGQIQIYGTAQQGYFQAACAIIVTAGVDPQGQLKIELTSADFGPMPVPSGLKDAITAVIQEAFTGAIGPVAVGFRLESIAVAGGTMTVIGRTK
jgi:hypothetical protein